MSNPLLHTLSYRQIFFIFFKLGCVSFGGPAAHLVFFQQMFVQKLHWLSESQYAQYVALCQMLPGPTSSQVGISIGYHLKGYFGALCAWFAFTLPSAIFMAGAALLGLQFYTHLDANFFHVIQLIVLAVVIWAFWQMLRSFCKEIWQYCLMLFTAIFVYVMHFSFNQILALVLAAIFSFVWMQLHKNTQEIKSNDTKIHIQNSNQHAYLWLIAFILPFIVLPIWGLNSSHISIKIFSDFYESAALVFGGGHIILPFLQQDFVQTGLVSSQSFDLGYALAQLMPGPLFSFASYLGVLLPITDSTILNTLFATIAIFLPSFLLVFGCLPYWHKLMNNQKLLMTIGGINAAVVGLLLCLIVQMGTTHITQIADVIFIGAVIVLLKSKLPIWLSLITSFAVYFSILNLI